MSRRSFLTARWCNLILANYAVPERLLRPLVPPGCALDFRDGRCWASLVGFQFLDTRVLGIGDAAASLVGPELYREFVWPYEKQLVDGVRAMGAKVRLHICGNTRFALAGMGQLGCDIVDLDYPSPLRDDGYEVLRALVPDERGEIAATLRALAGDADLVLTTGGTGVGAAADADGECVP